MIVIDASVWVSYLLPQEPAHQFTKQWLAQYLVNGGTLAAPIILVPEVAGAVTRRTRFITEGQQAIDYLTNLSPLRLLMLNRSLGLAAAQVAVDLQLKGADACYVAVAQRLRVPLVSWDQEQLRRASQLIQAYTPATIP